MEETFYYGDAIRLVEAQASLPRHAEGTVVRACGGSDGQEPGVEAQFYTASGLITATLPNHAVEPVLAHAGGCTTVFWGLGSAPAETFERAMHTMFDHGFAMRQGLNAVELHYIREERVWKKGERFHDPAGARVLAGLAAWDGCEAAFSGRERFQLEFHMRGRRHPFVLLHQRFETYGEARRDAAAAIALLRTLTTLYEALGAECCAVPVAGGWLMDESWDSLLQEPLYPDLFLIPLSRVPEKMPHLFRVAPLQHDKALLTMLPVKLAPGDEPPERTERDLKLDQIRTCKALGEKAYDQMYESSSSASAMYSDAKEVFYDAIRVASELGLKEEEETLSKRLEHIKAVYRHQFSR